MKNNNSRISVQINKQKEERGKDPIEQLLQKEKKPPFEDNSPPVYQPIHKKTKSNFWTTYRSFIYSALTAIIIGTFLGFLMLKIFVDMDPEEVSFNSNNQQVSSTVTASADGEKDEQTNEATATAFKSNAHQAYVVQAGVFSAESAATQLQNELKASNLPAVIWERDNQFHLFISVHSTSDASKNHLQSISTDMEMYGGKAWTTVPVEVSVSESEKTWLASFDKLLPGLFESKDISALKQWIGQKPANITPALASFVEKAEQISKNEQLDNQSKLELWYQYSQLADK
ncbi:SPOR domain-containing protein [Gracilibacillus oryzae]|uniref:SPOR domain-containing protein n=1 Tax=Gracilibacillus oryzae TaxID=1672701 RepID=A0A7C8GT86_9BACI|nr:SPOR domain-containing protein [Gracilibacillus oryzae]KAB8134728.1 SPOR domain-containing protein [Gracilibacillus oryzae]